MMMTLDPNEEVCSKIADFGTSRECLLPISGRFVDNPVWLAPEILTNSEYNFSADTYAFGVMMWESMTRKDYCGDLAFMSDIEDWIISGSRPPIPNERQGCPIPFQNIIQHCWVRFH
jgi:serine/threonine protein kinase